MVPLAGHTLGHVGVAVNVGGTGRGWLLHCGDAYFHHGEVDPRTPHCPPLIRAFERVTDTDRRTRLANQERLASLARDHGDRVELFSAHDPVELDRHQRSPSA